MTHKDLWLCLYRKEVEIMCPSIVCKEKKMQEPECKKFKEKV